MIRKFESSDFEQLATVMDEGRMQELADVGLTKVFIPLKKAPYLKYFLSCHIYVAEVDDKVVGFIGFKGRRIEFLYVVEEKQGKGIGSQLMETALEKMSRPIELSVFTENQKAKMLYKKYGFITTKTVTEKWSEDIPIEFSEDTMILR